uniref:NADH-ubiquinone oxidoreductase chain 4L n=1 Tax=Xya japonica TaxID=1661859 RepID=A0A7L9QCT3_9ORTH|nr:NADH dehydrogenase subunit 4L [Xya japonica]
MGMYYFMSLLGVFMFISSAYVYTSKRKHLMIILLSLEFMVLSLFILIINWMMLIQEEVYFLIMFFVFSVCEGSLGLTILVSMIRSHGNDYFSSWGMVLC